MSPQNQLSRRGSRVSPGVYRRRRAGRLTRLKALIHYQAMVYGSDLTNTLLRQNVRVCVTVRRCLVPDGDPTRAVLFRNAESDSQ